MTSEADGWCHRGSNDASHHNQTFVRMAVIATTRTKVFMVIKSLTAGRYF